MLTSYSQMHLFLAIVYSVSKLDSSVLLSSCIWANLAEGQKISEAFF